MFSSRLDREGTRKVDGKPSFQVVACDEVRPILSEAILGIKSSAKVEDDIEQEVDINGLPGQVRLGQIRSDQARSL